MLGLKLPVVRHRVYISIKGVIDLDICACFGYNGSLRPGLERRVLTADVSLHLHSITVLERQHDIIEVPKDKKSVVGCGIVVKSRGMSEGCASK